MNFSKASPQLNKKRAYSPMESASFSLHLGGYRIANITARILESPFQKISESIQAKASFSESVLILTSLCGAFRSIPSHVRVGRGPSVGFQ